MLDKFKEDQTWTGAVILLYTLPIFLWIFASMDAMGPYKSWSLFAIGLLIAFAGSVSLILLKRPTPLGQTKALEPLPIPVEATPNHELEELKAKLLVIQGQTQDTQKLQDENTALKNQNFQVIHAYNSLKKEMEELQSRADNINPETTTLIEKQNEVLQQSQEHIQELENRIEEMKYEMRALMNLNESDMDTHLTEDEILRK